VGLVMAVERCRPWRGVFLVFCIAPKGATTKAVVAAFAAATDTKRLCRHESTRKGLEGYMQISCRSRYLDSK